VRWTQQEYADFLDRATKAGSSRLHTGEPKQDQRTRLVPRVRRKAEGGESFKIVFRVYAVRPKDYDNIYTKPLQDLLVHAGCLPGDDWKTLSGEVISAKAKSEAEERTEIEIVKV
jgi:hypothetical protein